MKRSLDMVLEYGREATVLDYGCGPGLLVSMLRECGVEAVGYEPFMSERVGTSLSIYREVSDLDCFGGFDVITLFETIEHLESWELSDFLKECGRLLRRGGVVLLSAPVEIGPALFLKEANRKVRGAGFGGYTMRELVKAGLLGRAAARATDIKINHRGFDFRQAIQSLREEGWLVIVKMFGPMPLNTWYGNSQVYLELRPTGSE
jgi:SAM-dependent methyltransferase